MKSDRSLRRRIITAYVLLATVLCGLFAVAAFLTVEAVERELIGNRLNAEMERLMARGPAAPAPPLPIGMAAFRGDSIPRHLIGLGPGFHEVADGDRTLFVQVVDARGGRLALQADESGFERTEMQVTVILGAAFVACVLLALLLGRMTSSRVLAPLIALAEAVQADSAPDLGALKGADEVGMLARALAARTADLERFLVRERLFTGDVSHELRTPLAVILGAAEVLTVRLAERPDLLPGAERIRRAALDATERVSAMLLLSRSPEAIDRPRIALGPLVEHELERCRSLVCGKPVRLHLDVAAEAWVFARPELAAIALGNLMRNACQFTQDGAVTVTINAHSAVVEDTGPGIPAPVRERLFERFVHGSEGSGVGSGLGLAIVKRIAEHLDWKLSVEDRPGGGSRFALAFPPA